MGVQKLGQNSDGIDPSAAKSHFVIDLMTQLKSLGGSWTHVHLVVLVI